MNVDGKPTIFILELCSIVGVENDYKYSQLKGNYCIFWVSNGAATGLFYREYGLGNHIASTNGMSSGACFWQTCSTTVFVFLQFCLVMLGLSKN